MKWLFPSLILLLLNACSPEVIPYTDLEKNLSEQGVSKTVVQSPYELECIYRPPWLLANREIKEAQKKGEVTAEQIEAIIKPYEGSVTFVLKIGSDPNLDPKHRKMTDIVNAQASMGQFTQNLHHLFYGMDDKIYILTGKGLKVPVGSYYLDRNWGITHVNYLMLTFPAMFQDKRLMDEGDIEVVVQNLNESLPELRFYFKENPMKKVHHKSTYIFKCLEMENK